MVFKMVKKCENMDLYTFQYGSFIYGDIIISLEISDN